MNHINDDLLKKAETEAVYNIYLYLAHFTNPSDNESLLSITAGLDNAFKAMKPSMRKERDLYRLEILKNAVFSNPALAGSRIGSLTRSKNGLSACCFTKPGGDVSVVFRGTGQGEWIDNGEGLSGIPEENTYITYGKDGSPRYIRTIHKDYATDQQTEALNWFSRIAAVNGWSSDTSITVSGHSKGGNKAQFIAISSDLPDLCISFDGHGFSPEALVSFAGSKGFKERRNRIFSLSADNDYVNVLGKRLALKEHIYYFEARSGIHHLEAMLDKNGRLNRQCEQGRLSAYAETVSEELMSLRPSVRQYATLGIMNIFQKYLGRGTPVNNDSVSLEKTVAGLGVTIGSILNQFRKAH